MLPSTMQRLARLGGWLAVLAIVLLSVVPGNFRPQTGLPSALEHFGAYLGVCWLLAVGYGNRVAASVLALLLSLVAINLELVQLLVPRRYAGLLDGAASVAGAFAGAGLAWLFLLFVGRDAGRA